MSSASHPFSRNTSNSMKTPLPQSSNTNHYKQIRSHSALVLIFLVYMLGSPPQELPPGVWRKIDQHIRYVRFACFGWVLWVVGEQKVDGMRCSAIDSLGIMLPYRNCDAQTHMRPCRPTNEQAHI